MRSRRGSYAITAHRQSSGASILARLAVIADAGENVTGAENADLHTFLRDVLDYHMPRLVDPEPGTAGSS